MDNILKNKKAILSLVLLLVAFYAYSVFFGSDPGDVAVSPDESGEEIVNLAEELSGINFRQDVFSEPGYRYLIDFSTELSLQPMGRGNPFAPIGR